MGKIVVLNLIFKKDPYSELDIDTITDWINFFQAYGVYVIATPPFERKDAIDKLRIAKSDLFTFYPVMSFDTCDRWRHGLEKAIELSNKVKNTTHFYIWSADFDFNELSKNAAELLIHHKKNEDLVVGTIIAEGKKEQIDRYGTYPLLKLWFPDIYQKITDKGLTKPRSELLRLSHNFLKDALKKRWYPSEQTIYLILQCFLDKFTIASLKFPKISDYEEPRLSPNVIQQIERMELWIKYIWREHHKNWDKLEYIKKCENSFKILKNACLELTNR
jgi:hypothetical protein